MDISINIAPFIKVTCGKVEGSEIEYKCSKCGKEYEENSDIKFCPKDGNKIDKIINKTYIYPDEEEILEDFEQDLFYTVPSEFVPCIKKGECYILENHERPKTAPKSQEVDVDADIIVHDNSKIELELNWFQEFYKKEIELLTNKYKQVEVGYGTFIYYS